MITWDDYKDWLVSVAVGDFPSDLQAPAVSDLVTDSRKSVPGSWFVPLPGERVDGHQFIQQALDLGAAGFFYEPAGRSKIPEHAKSKGLAVTNCLTALQKVAAGWRRSLPDLKLLALTGSAGKTTTKEILAGILKTAGSTFATEGNFNNELGVPKTLQRLTRDHRFAVVEFGARRPGDIKALCAIATPNIVALINVGSAHLEIFGSREALLAAKLEIFHNSPLDAVLVANGDDPRILAGAAATGKRTLTFGTADTCDVRLHSSEWSDERGAMIIQLDLCGKLVAITTQVAHASLPINVAAAAAMALAAGVSADQIASGLEQFTGVQGRYQVHRSGPLTIIDDAYNANPHSMRAGLDTLAKSYPNQRCALVLGDMLELGSESEAEHFQIGFVDVALLAPELLIAVGPLAKAYGRGALKAGIAPSKILEFASVDELIAAHIDFGASANVIYAKASNSIRLSRFIESLLAVAPRPSTGEKPR